MDRGPPHVEIQTALFRIQIIMRKCGPVAGNYGLQGVRPIPSRIHDGAYETKCCGIRSGPPFPLLDYAAKVAGRKPDVVVGST